MSDRKPRKTSPARIPIEVGRDARSGRQVAESDPERVHHARLFGRRIPSDVDEAPDHRGADERDRHRHEDDRLRDPFAESPVGQHGDREAERRRGEGDDHDPPQVVDERAAQGGEHAERQEQETEHQREEGRVAELDGLARQLLLASADVDGQQHDPGADEERRTGEHVGPVVGEQTVVVGEDRAVVLEADPELGVAVEQRQVRGPDRRDDQHDRDEQEGRAGEDHRTRPGLELDTLDVVGVGAERDADADEERRHDRGDQRHREVAVADVGGAPGAEHPTDGGTEEGAGERRTLPEHAQPGAEATDDHGVEHRRERIELGVVGVADDEAGDHADGGEPADGDHTAAGRVVVGGEQPADRPEARSAGERADDPREEAGAGTDRDEVAVQQDADDRPDRGVGQGLEHHPAGADLVEEEVQPDPQPGARGDGDDDGDRRRADLLLDERPEDEAEDRHRPERVLGFLFAGELRAFSPVRLRANGFRRVVGVVHRLQDRTPLSLCVPHRTHHW